MPIDDGEAQRRAYSRLRTTFKAYRRDILEQVPLYGELHRFIRRWPRGTGHRFAKCHWRDARSALERVQGEHPTVTRTPGFARDQRMGEFAPANLRQTSPARSCCRHTRATRLRSSMRKRVRIRDELFVAVLGSNYTYAKQLGPSRVLIGSALTFERSNYGRCPESSRPTTLNRACTSRASTSHYQSTYGEMASHYSVAVIPARSKKPV